MVAVETPQGVLPTTKEIEMTNALITRNTIATATSKQLLAFFNAHTGGNQLVKFQNRLQGEARVLALINEMEAEEAGDQKAANAACKRGDELILAEVPGFGALISKQEFNHNTSEGRKAAAQALGKALSKADGRNARVAAVATSGLVKPYQGAKAIVADCIGKGITARKDIIAAGLAAGIKYNTIDGAHYTMCVKKD